MSATAQKAELQTREVIADADLPEGWASVPLHEVVNHTKGKKPKELAEEPWPAAIPYIDIEAFETGRVRRYADPKTSVVVNKGDVVVVWDGARSGLVGKVPTKGALGSTLARIEPQLMDNGYLLRFLESSYETINSNPRGTGIPHVNPEFFWNLSFPVSPIPEQKRIVAKVEELLTQVNASCARLAKAPKILKRFRQSVLAAACSGHLTEDWREQHRNVESSTELVRRIEESRKQNGDTPREKLVDTVLDRSEFSQLPESWMWAGFGSLLGELRNGISTKPEQEPPGHPILRISSVRAGQVLLDERRYLPNADELVKVYKLCNRDLLFTRYNGSLDLLGVCGMVRGLGKEVLLYPDKLMRVRFDHPYLLPEFAEIYFASPSARDHVTAKSKSSAGQQGVSGADIKAQPFALPPLEEQHEIVRRVEALFKLADTIEKRVEAATKRAEKLTQAILARAFRGELVPTEAELALREGRTYEPASVLLERIRREREAKSEDKTKVNPRRKGRKILPQT
jgi:type I restriction enzyme S subunit